jgi:RNA polymerase sigma-70 factor (ECF subfamily)
VLKMQDMKEDSMRTLERWVETYQSVVFRAAYLILRDEDSAADVAQDTFVRAWRAADRITDEQGVRPWLYRIAVNTALNHLRKLRRETAAIARIDTDQSLVDATDRSDITSVVSAAIDRLPDRLRVAVICRYFLDLSELQTARTLSVRPGTVKSRLHEARRLLAGDENLAMAAGQG